MAGTRQWWIGALLVALAAAGTTAATAEQPPLVVHVDDRMGVPAQDLAAARREVEEIFIDAGISILWKEGRFPASVIGSITGGLATREVAVVLITNTDDPLPGASGCTLGFAAKRPAVAYAYHNRVIEQSLLHPIDARVLLGRVIAHELGHVLLPLKQPLVTRHYAGQYRPWAGESRSVHSRASSRDPRRARRIRREPLTRQNVIRAAS